MPLIGAQTFDEMVAGGTKIMDAIAQFFGSTGFILHGYCFHWSPGLALPSPKQLERANSELLREVAARRKVEEQLQACTPVTPPDRKVDKAMCKRNIP